MSGQVVQVQPTTTTTTSGGGTRTKSRSGRSATSQHQARLAATADWLADLANNNFQRAGPENAVPVIQLFQLGTNRVKSVNLSVPCARVFALIGPRRAGKTGLLETMARIRSPHCGKVKYLAESSKCRLSVGFMPQFGGFFAALSPVENIYYQAQYHAVPPVVMHQKLHRLMQLLGWDYKRTPVGQLTQQQQVLVSLALASIHSPAILFLDQPDFGTDLLLKEQAWRQLRHLTRQQEVTIVFSSVAMEDVRFADEAALVKSGTLTQCSLKAPIVELDHKEPKEHDSTSITSSEESLVDLNRLLTVDTAKIGQFANQYYYHQSSVDPEDKDQSTFKGQVGLQMQMRQGSNAPNAASLTTKRQHRQRPLIARTFLTLLLMARLMVKSPFGLLAKLLAPGLVILLVHQMVGHNPYHISVAVYNPDVPAIVSKHVLNSVDSHTVHLVDYGSLEQALDAVRQHQAWAAIEFPRNYTNSMINRALHNCDSNTDDFEEEPEAETISGHIVMNNNNRLEKLSEDVEKEKPEREVNAKREHNLKELETEEHWPLSSETDLSSDVDVNKAKRRPVNFVTIRLHVDNTNLLVSGFVKAKVFQALLKAQSEAAQIEPQAAKWPQPLEVVEPNVYGAEESPMSEFLLPGLLVIVVYFSNAFFSMEMLSDVQKVPIYHTLRLVSVSRILWFNCFTLLQLAIIALQVSIALGLLALRQVPMLGPMWMSWVIVFQQGVLATSATKLLTLICAGRQSHVVSLHAFYLGLLLLFGGLLWPLDSLPLWMRHSAFFWPQPAAAELLRYIWSRGWSLDHFNNPVNPIVWLGLNIPFFWDLALTLFILIANRVMQ